jgi:GT2 family glycosyltransferase
MNEKLKIIFLIVLYEKNFETSQTLKSLIQVQKKINYSSIIIWDNSKLPQTDINEIKNKLSDINNIEYFSNSMNTSLSSIYNYFFENKIKGYDYITLLDHDSILTDNFIIELLDVAVQKKHNLILPKIISNGKLVSPAKLFYFKGKFFKKLTQNVIKTKFLTAINSGMTIKASYIIETKFRYDENLKFYGTDDNFMKTYQKHCDHAYVLNSKIKHELNYFSNEPNTQKVWRFKQMMFGIIYLNDDNVFLKFITTLYVFLISIKECIKNRNLNFIYFKWKS